MQVDSLPAEVPGMRPHRQQPTRLPPPWDSPGKNTGVGCHFLLQCMKVKSERDVSGDFWGSQEGCQGGGGAGLPSCALGGGHCGWKCPGSAPWAALHPERRHTCPPWRPFYQCTLWGLSGDCQSTDKLSRPTVLWGCPCGHCSTAHGSQGLWHFRVRMMPPLACFSILFYWLCWDFVTVCKLSLVAVGGFLIAVASLVAELRL